MNDKLKNTFKRHLAILESNSTCARVQVGALITKDKRIISTGWNGVPTGFEHCDMLFNIVPKSINGEEQFLYFAHGNEVTKEEFLELHHKFSEEYECHAELNAIAFAAKSNISTQNAEMFVTITPCSNCAKLILSSGIKKIYYKSIYDRNPAGFNLLKIAESKGQIVLEQI